MEKVQLFFFFVSGFLVSRLLIKVRAPQWLVFQLVGRRHLGPTRILLYLIGSSALLSVFIPNVLTVLTILPVVELLRRPLEAASTGRANRIPTYLALALIYGANIGGMGSVTATPANGILITYALIGGVENTTVFAFEQWLFWGLPLVVAMSLVAWGLLAAVYRPDRHIAGGAVLPFSEDATHHPLQHVASGLTLVFFASSIALSVWMQKSSSPRMVLGATVLFTLAYCAYLLIGKARGTADESQRILTIPDCYSDLPMRGIGFVLVFLVLTGILALLGVQRYLAGALTALLPPGTPFWEILLGFALVTSFSTEFLSNTVVQIAMFTIIAPLAASLETPSAALLLIVTLSCTSAFMSPAATGVNGLAFGEIRGMSLTQMLLVGMVMNVAGALVLSFWVRHVVAWLAGWPV